LKPNPTADPGENVHYCGSEQPSLSTEIPTFVDLGGTESLQSQRPRNPLEAMARLAAFVVAHPPVVALLGA
jgi:hypothetical protein